MGHRSVHMQFEAFRSEVTLVIISQWEVQTVASRLLGVLLSCAEMTHSLNLTVRGQGHRCYLELGRGWKKTLKI